MKYAAARPPNPSSLKEVKGGVAVLSRDLQQHVKQVTDKALLYQCLLGEMCRSKSQPEMGN